jgi:hypothetical protein
VFGKTIQWLTSRRWIRHLGVDNARHRGYVSVPPPRTENWTETFNLLLDDHNWLVVQLQLRGGELNGFVITQVSQERGAPLNVARIYGKPDAVRRCEYHVTGAHDERVVAVVPQADEVIEPEPITLESYRRELAFLENEWNNNLKRWRHHVG